MCGHRSPLRRRTTSSRARPAPVNSTSPRAEMRAGHVQPPGSARAGVQSPRPAPRPDAERRTFASTLGPDPWQNQDESGSEVIMNLARLPALHAAPRVTRQLTSSSSVTGNLARHAPVLACFEFLVFDDDEHRLAGYAQHVDHEAQPNVGAVVGVRIVDDVATGFPERLTGLEEPR